MEKSKIDSFILDIISLENRAYKLGMIITAHKLNDAKNEAGWELADKITKS